MARSESRYSSGEILDVLDDMYTAINEEFYAGNLSGAIISIHTDAINAMFRPAKMCDIAGKQKDEIDIPVKRIKPDGIKDIYFNLLICCMRQFAYHEGLKISSNRGYYINKKALRIADKCGIILVKHHKYGYVPQDMTFRAKQIFNKNDWYIPITFAQDIKTRIQHAINLSEQKSDKYNSSTRKYTCSCCNVSFRATKAIGVMIHHDCGGFMVSDRYEDNEKLREYLKGISASLNCS